MCIILHTQTLHVWYICRPIDPDFNHPLSVWIHMPVRVSSHVERRVWEIHSSLQIQSYRTDPVRYDWTLRSYITVSPHITVPEVSVRPDQLSFFARTTRPVQTVHNLTALHCPPCDVDRWVRRTHQVRRSFTRDPEAVGTKTNCRVLHCR